MPSDQREIFASVLDDLSNSEAEWHGDEFAALAAGATALRERAEQDRVSLEQARKELMADGVDVDAAVRGALAAVDAKRFPVSVLREMVERGPDDKTRRKGREALLYLATRPCARASGSECPHCTAETIYSEVFWER